MHALSTIAVTSAAFSCGALVLVTSLGHDGKNAPLATAAQPDSLSAQKVYQPPSFSDRFALPIPPVLATEPITSAASPVTGSAEADVTASRSMKPVKQTRAKPRDVCQRHGLRKRYFRDRPNHRSWRCRK